MKIETSRFGELEIDEEQIFTFWTKKTFLPEADEKADFFQN